MMHQVEKYITRVYLIVPFWWAWLLCYSDQVRHSSKVACLTFVACITHGEWEIFLQPAQSLHTHTHHHRSRDVLIAEKEREKHVLR